MLCIGSKSSAVSQRSFENNCTWKILQKKIFFKITAETLPWSMVVPLLFAVVRIQMPSLEATSCQTPHTAFSFSCPTCSGPHLQGLGAGIDAEHRNKQLGDRLTYLELQIVAQYHSFPMWKRQLQAQSSDFPCHGRIDSSCPYGTCLS